MRQIKYRYYTIELYAQKLSLEEMHFYDHISFHQDNERSKWETRLKLKKMTHRCNS